MAVFRLSSSKVCSWCIKYFNRTADCLLVLRTPPFGTDDKQFINEKFGTLSEKNKWKQQNVRNRPSKQWCAVCSMFLINFIWIFSWLLRVRNTMWPYLQHGVKSKIMEYSVFARIAIAYAINHLFNTWKELAMNVWKLHAAQKNNIDISTARFYCFCLVLPFTDNN